MTLNSQYKIINHPYRSRRSAEAGPQSLGNPSSVCCLLYSLSCLQSSAPRPNRLFSPLCQRIMTSIMQNKPNCRNDKTNATSCAPKIYINMSLRSAPKNKPNQTQFPRPKVAPPAKRQQRTWNTASSPGIIPKITLIALHKPSFTGPIWKKLSAAKSRKRSLKLWHNVLTS